jgi:hypothetical protein
LGESGTGSSFVRGKARWATASKMDRAVLCPASTVIPEVESEPGNSAIWGSAWHQVVELGALGERECRDKVTGAVVKVEWPRWVVKGVSDKLANLPRALGDIRGEFWPGNGTHETKGLIDGDEFEVASLLVDGGPYPIREGSIRAKVDYIGEKLGEPWVDDLKTGREPTPADSLQIGVAALIVAQVTGAQGVWGSVTHWPRYPKSNEPEREWQYYDAEALSNVRKVLKVIRGDALSPFPTINPARDEWGEPVGQCKWCGSRPNCPAWKGQE